MCWFGARWNVQRNVTCIVNCTIPWTNRYANTYRDVWAHPARAWFSANCIQLYTQCVCIAVCVSVLCNVQEHGNADACDHVHQKALTTMHPQLCATCFRGQCSTLFSTSCTIDRDWGRGNRLRCVHEAMPAHPPNLSILVSGGEHTTLYVFSHCERTSIISQFQLFACALNCCIQLYCQFGCGCKLIVTHIHWGWQPRMEPAHIYLRFTQHD